MHILIWIWKKITTKIQYTGQLSTRQLHNANITRTNHTRIRIANRTSRAISKNFKSNNRHNNERHKARVSRAETSKARNYRPTPAFSAGFSKIFLVHTHTRAHVTKACKSERKKKRVFRILLVSPRFDKRSDAVVKTVVFLWAHDTYIHMADVTNRTFLWKSKNLRL